MSAATVAPTVKLPRAHGRALAIAAATLWLPALLPLVLGMLRDSDSAMKGYLMLLPLAPGMIVPALLQLQVSWQVLLAAGAPTLLVFVGLWQAARRLPSRPLHTLQVVVMVLVAFESIGLANAALM